MTTLLPPENSRNPDVDGGDSLREVADAIGMSVVQDDWADGGWRPDSPADRARAYRDGLATLAPSRRPEPARRGRAKKATAIVDRGDVSADVVADRLGTTLAAFNGALPNLVARGFPAPDPDTGNFDVEAIDAWRRARNRHLFPEATIGPRDASNVVTDRLAQLRGAKRG